ncbi:TlpA disulfide reductase family protein [Mesorhizobium sp. WSM2239]|uniref:TlpA disulfide reductase family protein n=2 Tax=unclassified Mesorhizobium TaxID=325217 RepID=A0AAU8DB39_9HYPH
MADRKKLIPVPRLLAVAALAGALAGAVAVYVSATLSGNNAPPSAAGAVVNADTNAKLCAAKADRARTVAAAATGEVAAMLPADPPQSLKTLAFNAPDGASMTLADRAGKTLLVNLWATWCAPCRAEMPALDALQKELGSEKFEVVAVNVDAGDDAKPKKFLADTGVEALGYYRDNTMAMFEELKTRGLALGLPVTLLVDGEGCLLAHMNGPAEWSSDDAKKLIGVALSG